MRNTIKNHDDFQMNPDFPRAVNDLFSIRTKLAKFKYDPRYGVIANKRHFRHAVQRNRAKRLLRDWMRFASEYMCPDLDYVFFARQAILDENVTREMGRKLMVKALRSIKHNNDRRRK